MEVSYLSVAICLFLSLGVCGNLPAAPSDLHYERAIENSMCAASPYVLITSVDAKSGFGRVACIEARTLIVAIRQEQNLFSDKDPWKEAIEFALNQKDGVFAFSNREALRTASPRYTEEALSEIRDFVKKMPTEDVMKDISRERSQLHRLCRKGMPRWNRSYFDAVAHVLMERGVACGRAVNGRLLFIDRNTEDEALPRYCLTGTTVSSDRDVEWGLTVDGLRCRLYLDENEEGPYVKTPLIVEVQNVTKEPIVIPVCYYGVPDLVLTRLTIKEEPEVRSPSSSGYRRSDRSYTVRPGAIVSSRVYNSHIIAYWTKTESGFARFKPESRLYHVTAKVRTSSGELISNTVAVRLR